MIYENGKVLSETMKRLLRIAIHVFSIKQPSKLG